MSYNEKLTVSAEKYQSLLCFGMDPVIEKFPSSIKGNTKEKIVKFYSSIIDASLSSNPSSFSALKPNYAFYAQYGWEGLQALKELIDKYKSKYPIILDVKRGDIGSTAKAYAKEGYEFWGADALTLSPFMGKDSVEPYFNYFEGGKGAYLLCRTSNAGAQDFICQKMGAKPLYLHILSKAIGWHKDGLGLVVGATDAKDLAAILKEIDKSGKRFSLLIPGVGSQGGSAGEVMALLGKYPALLPLARINASSSISYAFEKQKTTDFVGSSLAEIASLNKFLVYKG